MSVNLTEAREYLVELLPQAGVILNKHFRAKGLRSYTKDGEVDLVTEADEEVDTFLNERIEERFTGLISLTEESAKKRFAHLHGDYSSLLNEELIRVEDSLDGTVNFSRGRANFAISEALVSKGRTVLGVAYVPQTGETFWAQEDVDGFYKIDSQGEQTRLHVSTVSDIHQASFAVDWVVDIKDRSRTFRYFSTIVDSPMRQIVSMGSAVSDLTHLAAGELEAYFNCGLKPWDVAAVSLFVEKSGGKVTTPLGGRFNVFERDVLATNGRFHDLLVDRFSKIVQP